ncbi:hypothetical protein [Psychrobacter sp. I-STPA10]|uniref:hypothetical protein n=1 Tax=Psychrobacter sp. I-STPA10 TaxID=2585769 RepID=UPI001E4038D6|nr:hypothetical protein [Psychrobacter sp. I-STPA10]
MPNQSIDSICPNCQSDDTVLSTKRQQYTCEDCEHQWNASIQTASENKILSANEDKIINEKDFCKSLANSELWQKEILNNWPAPIAHEYHRLQTILDEGTFITAILQLKDIIEVVIKFTTISMHQWLQHTDPNFDPQEMNQKLFAALSLGHWMGMMRNNARAILDSQTANYGLGQQLATWLYNPRQSAAYRLLNDMVSWRNDEIGHGALRLQTQELWEDFAQRLEQLHRILIDNNPWKHTTLYTQDPDNLDNIISPLIGSESIRQRHDKLTPQSITAHHISKQNLYLNFNDTKHNIDILLSPYIHIHTCRKCHLQDIFIYDSYGKQGFYHLDYLSGHRIRLAKHEAQPLSNILEQINLEHIADEDNNLQQHALNQSIVDLLESKSLEADYLYPQYLYQALTNFIDDQDQGLMWLQAPAHIGKSIFVHSIGSQMDNNPAIDSLIAIKFHIRREFRYFAHHLIESINGQLKTAFNLTSGTQALPQIDLKQGHLALINWLNQWWNISPQRHTHRLLIAIDGLDEIGKPDPNNQHTQTSILDILPQSQDLAVLNEGIYLLLTSRPIIECPTWMQPQLDNQLSSSYSIQIDLEHKEYQKLLWQYLNAKLQTQLQKFNKEEKASLFTTLLEKSEKRFLYFSLLINLIQEQQLTPSQLQQLPKGQALYGHYLQNLEILLGKESKQFQRIQDLLTLLTACEQAAVTDADIQNSAMTIRDTEDTTITGSSEQVGNLYWRGLDLATIAGLLEEPAGIWSSQLIFTLYSLKSLFKVERSGEQAHYRLGLKELGEFIDEYWGGEVERWHERLSIPFYRTWQEQWDLLATDINENLYQLRYLLSHAQRVRELTFKQLNDKQDFKGNYIDEYFLLIINDEDLLKTYYKKYELDNKASYYLSALEWINLYLYCLQSENDISDNKKINSIAEALMRRGQLIRTLGDSNLALVNYNKSILLLKNLQKKSEKEESITSVWKDNLVGTLVRRGNLLRSIGDLISAINDYNYAVSLQEHLCQVFNRKSSDLYFSQNSLAMVLNNRGNLFKSQRNYQMALSDYNKAIFLRKNIYKNKEFLNRDSDKYQDDLASVLNNRGNLFRNYRKFDLALEDYNFAVVLRKDLYERLKYSKKYQRKWKNNLARVLNNRGSLLEKKCDYVSALNDFNISVRLREELYFELNPLGNYSPKWQSDFIDILKNRGKLYTIMGKYTYALEDYNRAIALSKNLYDKLHNTINYLPKWQNSLANCIMNRGSLFYLMGNDKRTLENYNESIELSKDLYNKISDDNYSLDWNHTFNNLLVNQVLLLSLKKSENINYYNDIEKYLVLYEKLERTLEEDIDSLDNWKNNIIDLLVKRGNYIKIEEKNYKKALDYYSQAINLYKDLYNLLSGKSIYSFRWKNDLIEVLMLRSLVHKELENIPAMQQDLEQARQILVELVIKQSKQEYLSRLLELQHRLHEMLNLHDEQITDKLNQSTKILIANIESTYATEQLTTDEIQWLDKLKSLINT